MFPSPRAYMGGARSNIGGEVRNFSKCQRLCEGELGIFSSRRAYMGEGRKIQYIDIFLHISHIYLHISHIFLHKVIYTSSRRGEGARKFQFSSRGTKIKNFLKKTSCSAFSHQSKGKYLVAKPKHEDHVSCLADSH